MLSFSTLRNKSFTIKLPFGTPRAENSSGKCASIGVRCCVQLCNCATVQLCNCATVQTYCSNSIAATSWRNLPPRKVQQSQSLAFPNSWSGFLTASTKQRTISPIVTSKCSGRTSKSVALIMSEKSSGVGS